MCKLECFTYLNCLAELLGNLRCRILYTTHVTILMAPRPLFGNTTPEPAPVVGALSSMVHTKSGGTATVFWGSYGRWKTFPKPQQTSALPIELVVVFDKTHPAISEVLAGKLKSLQDACVELLFSFLKI